jgi:ribosomal protein L40E
VLAVCRYCGRVVGLRAAVCRHCGERLPEVKTRESDEWLLTVTLAGIAVLVLAAYYLMYSR